MSRIPTGSLVPLLLAAASATYAQDASEERAVAAFSRLIVEDGIDVHLTQAAEPSLRVEVEGYDLEDVVAEVEGGELRLSRAGQPRGGGLGGLIGGIFRDYSITVYLDFVDLAAIEASGGSDIHGRNTMQLEGLAVTASGGSDVDIAVDATSLELTLSGGSDADIRGSAQSLDVTASGGSDVEAGGLQVERARLALSGGSDAEIRASAAVEIDASGGSDVEVYGNPGERTVSNDRASDVEWL